MVDYPFEDDTYQSETESTLAVIHEDEDDDSEEEFIPYFEPDNLKAMVDLEKRVNINVVDILRIHFPRKKINKDFIALIIKYVIFSLTLDVAINGTVEDIIPTFKKVAKHFEIRDQWQHRQYVVVMNYFDDFARRFIADN